MRRAALMALLAVSPAQARAPARVVSLHPAATEILLALDASDLLVARMEGDRAPARERSAPRAPDPLAHLPSVGEMLSPSLEVLASVEPDLVIVWEGAERSALARVVERRGGRVEAIAVDRLADVVPAIEKIGAWVGREPAAARLAVEFATTLAEARALGSAGAGVRVLWVVGSEPVVVAGPETFIDDVIEAAGGENAAASAAAPWPRLGMEALVALDPDVLVWPDAAGVFDADELRTRGGWRALRAVREGRVLAVDAERFHDAGPEIADATLELARDLEGMVGRP